MNTLTDYLITGIVIGIGGSALMDLWGLFLRRASRVPTLDYALLGRWLGHMPRVGSPTGGSPMLHPCAGNGRSVGRRTT